MLPSGLQGQAWREDLLNLMLRVSVALGSVVYLFSVYKAVAHGLWAIVVADTVALAGVVVLWRWHTLSYPLRAAMYGLLIYALAAVLTSVATGVGMIFLLGQSVLATMLLGLRAGLVTVGINAATPLVLGALGLAGWIIAPAGWSGDLGDWALIALNFLLIDTLVVLVVGAVLRSLEQALGREVAARAVLAQRERHLQALIDATPEGVLELTDGIITEVNPAGVALLEAETAVQLRGEPAVRFVAPHDMARFASWRGAAPAVLASPITLEVIGLRGGRRIVEVTGSALPGEGPAADGGSGQRQLALVRDITLSRRLQDELREPQRLDAVGKLTGGVAHDFNNLLTVILGNADILVSHLRDDAAARNQAEMIRTAAQRGADLVARMLAFAKRQSLAPQPTDVAALLDAMRDLLTRTLGAPVALQIDHASGLWPALVDPAQLESAILNLCINARDAMPGGGRLHLETANTTVPAAAATPDQPAGDYVRVTVSDTGQGMTPQVLARAFEPFFTTKEVGRGTGLGLSMVYGFVRQSNGHIGIASTPGRGTVVTLHLPRAAQEAVTWPPVFTRARD